MGTAGATHHHTTTADGVVVLPTSCWCRWKGGANVELRLVTAADVRGGRTWSCGSTGCCSPIGQADARTYTRKGGHAVLDELVEVEP